MTRVRRAAALAVTLTAAFLATTANTDARAAAPSAAPAATTAPATRAATPTTHLKLVVDGCRTCSVSLVHAVTGQQHVWTSKAKRIGSDDRVAFTLATKKTHGLSFTLDAPWAGSTGAVPNLVTQYQGAKIDSQVTRDQARAAKHAAGCWAGTGLDVVTLRFDVAHINGRDVAGNPTKLPLAYATHTMSSWRPMVRAYRGTIGNQDAFYCTKPATTKLTLNAAGCEGCQVALVNGARHPDNTWESGSGVVKDGSVTFSVPRALTRGLSAVVTAPWENDPHPTGYLTTVVWRYAGHTPGTDVSFADAREQTRASACWAGTHQAASTIDLTVRKVRVLGNGGMTNGSIAFTSVTQESLRPVREVRKGIYGTQEVIVCRK